MKKITTLFITIFTLYNFGYSQFINIMLTKKPTESYSLISCDRAYSAILNTDLKKEQLIDKTKSLFLEEGLADSAQLATVVYDEKLSEYKIRFGFSNGQLIEKGMMGIKFVAPAVTLYFDAIFSFNNLGQIKITFTNFDSEVLGIKNDKGILNTWRNADIYGGPEIVSDTVVWNEYQTLVVTETAMGKALLWANGRLDLAQKATRGEFRKKLNEQFNTYEGCVNTGSGVWITKENIANYEVQNNKYWNDQVTKLKADKLVLSVDNYRWDNYFELNYNYFFKEIAYLINGQIDKIAMDGNVKYQIYDGKLLPVDEKERKTWLKKNIEF